MGWTSRVKNTLQVAWHKLLHLDDTPHRIALGCAIGVFVAMMPIVGIQMVTAAVICKLFRANAAASLPWAWITNPVTIPPIYFGTYKLGAIFVDGDVTYDALKDRFSQINEMGFWESVIEGYRVILDIYWPMVVGGAISGLALAVICYFFMRSVVVKMRKFRATKSAKAVAPVSEAETSVAADADFPSPAAPQPVVLIEDAPNLDLDSPAEPVIAFAPASQLSGSHPAVKDDLPPAK